MSEQTNQSSELPWGKRPVAARDMVSMVGVIVLACIGTAILTIYVLQNQPRPAPVTFFACGDGQHLLTRRQ